MTRLPPKELAESSSPIHPQDFLSICVKIQVYFLFKLKKQTNNKFLQIPKILPLPPKPRHAGVLSGDAPPGPDLRFCTGPQLRLHQRLQSHRGHNPKVFQTEEMKDSTSNGPPPPFISLTGLQAKQFHPRSTLDEHVVPTEPLRSPPDPPSALPPNHLHVFPLGAPDFHRLWVVP